MDFLNLTENDCGQVNFLVQLSTHMVQDVARQESIGDPSRTFGLAQNNFMPPQSFRMQDLMNEMNTSEPQRSFVPVEHSTSSLDSQWTTENHQNEEARNYSSFLPMPSYENFSMMCSRDQPPWNIGFPNSQVPLPFYPQHNFGSQLDENSEYFTNKSEQVFEDSLDQLDASYQCEKQNKALENKVQRDTESKPLPQKYWKGIPIYDESVLSNLLETKTETYTYVACLNDYGERCIDKQWKPRNSNERFESEPIRDKLIPNAEDYLYIKNNPMRDCDNPFPKAKQEFSKGNMEDAILYAEEAARQNPEDIDPWRFLQIVYQTELRNVESFFAAKQILRLDPTHTLAHSMMTIVYLKDRCFYEAFETMVHWLKNHQSYGDIPLNFSMVENLSGLTDRSAKTWINSNQHIVDGVKNMLLTAARRNPNNADLNVQSFLSYIFSFTMEYEKSADCLTTIAYAKKEDVRHPNSCYNAAYNLFLCGKPYEALDNLLIGIENSDNKMKDNMHELIGIIYMYLTNYREAIRYFKEALEIDRLDEEFALPKRGNTLEAENELCLRLYSKLYDKLN